MIHLYQAKPTSIRLNVRGLKILVLSDLHFPWSVDDWFEFLQDLQAKHNYDLWVSVGDEVDGASISFHEKDPGLPSPSDELEMSIECMKKLESIAPGKRIFFCDSNHGSLVYRRQKYAGLPVQVIKPLCEIYDTPLFSWHEEIILETNSGLIYITHGKKAGYGAGAKEVGSSMIQGHYHSKSEITWHETIGGMRFNCFTGCLADRDKLAMRYAKANLPMFINSVVDLDADGIPSTRLYKRYVPKFEFRDLTLNAPGEMILS